MWGTRVVWTEPVNNVLAAVNNRQFVLLGLFALGCGVGLLLFTKLLKFLLDTYHDLTMAFLLGLGLVLGSLWAIWPFKSFGMAGGKRVDMDNVLPARVRAQRADHPGHGCGGWGHRCRLHLDREPSVEGVDLACDRLRPPACGRLLPPHLLQTCRKRSSTRGWQCYTSAFVPREEPWTSNWMTSCSASTTCASRRRSVCGD